MYAEFEKEGEASDGGCVGGAGATHDDAEDVNFNAICHWLRRASARAVYLSRIRCAV
jgi:hypothetical protein